MIRNFAASVRDRLYNKYPCKHPVRFVLAPGGPWGAVMEHEDGDHA